MAAGPSPHLVLARKWRPERFEELVGQEHVTRTLVKALESGRIAHAFLFTGIRGVGKTTAARILSRCLNCERGPTPAPCGECPACVEIRAGRALDVSEIDGATYRKIDDARAIIENLSYRPARDRYKIYIIDEAHQLTDQAFNALLKTLEEPPEHVKFILATTEPQKMPETILSRLQRYDFRRIPFANILARLKELATREGIEVEEGALRLLAREAGGSMRDAERMLESALASGGKVAESEVAAALGVASRGAVLELADAILKRTPEAALRKVRELHERGASLEACGRDLLETLRYLVVAKLPGNGPQSPLADLPDHEAAELRRMAEAASLRDLMRLFRLMADAQEEILRSPYADLLLEMAAVRMATIAPVMDAEDLLRAIGAQQADSGSSGSAQGGPAGSGGAARSAAPPEPAPGAHRMRVEGEVKAEAPRRPLTAAPASASPAASPAPTASPSATSATNLADLRLHIRSRRAALAGFMEQGSILALKGDVLTITPRNDIYVRYLADNRNVVAELASEFYGRRIKVEVSAPDPNASPENNEPGAEGGAPNGAGVPSAGASPPRNGDSKVYSDPLVRRIFDTLEARLVEVRELEPPTPASPAEEGGENPNEE